MKKTIVASLSLLLLTHLAFAQEALPASDVQRVAPKLAEVAGDLKDPAVKISPNAAKAHGMKVKNYVVMILPDENLTSEKLAKADDKIVPVGHLWMSRLTPVVDGKATPKSDLNMVGVRVDREEAQLPIFQLGAKKNSAGDLELLVIAKGKEPLVKLPLNKVTFSADLPIELDMRPGGESLGLIDVIIFGKHRATLPAGELQ